LTPGPLDDMIENEAKQGCYVSIVGISSGFNTQLAEVASKHKGCNYFCITKADELHKVAVADFDWNFFPAAFEVEVAQQSGDYDLLDVYGTPYDAKDEQVQASWTPLTHRFYPPSFREQARALLLCARRLSRSRTDSSATAVGIASGSLPMPALQRILDFLSPAVRSVIRVDTVFPSGVGSDGSVEGGLVLLRFRPRPGLKATAAGKVRLMLQYTADGDARATCVDVDIPSQAPGALGPGVASSADSVLKPALRKGVVLQRFIEVCRRFLAVAKADSNSASTRHSGAALFRPQLRAIEAAQAPKPQTTVDEGVAEGRKSLSGALSDVEDLRQALDGSEAVAADVESMCPGLLEQLRGFVDKARSYVKDQTSLAAQ